MPSASRALLLLVCASCIDFSSPDPRPVASVEITDGSFVLGPAETRTVTVIARDAAGEPISGREVVWATSNHLVASVAGGIVTAHAFGAATIFATIEGHRAQAEVTVTATQPAHLQGAWRMQSFDNKTLPATYLFLPDEPVGDDLVDVDIRLDSVKMQLTAAGKYEGRQYCFTELHDAVPFVRYCWGDHGTFTLGNPAGRIAFVSDYIQNLSAFGSVTSTGGLALVEPLATQESPRATRWSRVAN